MKTIQLVFVRDWERRERKASVSKELSKTKKKLIFCLAEGGTNQNQPCNFFFDIFFLFAQTNKEVVFFVFVCVLNF